MPFTWSRNQTPYDPDVHINTDGPPVNGTSSDTKTTVGGLLVDLYTYLAANVENHQQLADVIPSMSYAVKAYPGCGTSPDPYAPIRAVMGLITAAQRSDPTLPAPT